jgi:hypothetical protein
MTGYSVLIFVPPLLRWLQNRAQRSGGLSQGLGAAADGVFLLLQKNLVRDTGQGENVAASLVLRKNGMAQKTSMKSSNHAVRHSLICCVSMKRRIRCV